MSSGLTDYWMSQGNVLSHVNRFIPDRMILGTGFFIPLKNYGQVGQFCPSVD